jgi:ketosteroid isomerase-like protein
MPETSAAVKEFFDAYARATASCDPAFLESAYAEAFMFAGPAGVHAVKRDEFLKIVPKRKAFFAAVGLLASGIRRLDEIALDSRHVLVKAVWEFRFHKDQGREVVDEGAATYVLRREEDGLRILFQLDHQDLMKRVQELGLLRG